jgi:predicted Na+-dependent transporter
VTVAMLAISALVGSLMLDRFEIDGVDQRIIWATILFSMGWTMYGMALGAIVRQPIAAIVILLIQGLVAEPLLATLLKWTGPWMPFQNGIQMTQRSGDPDLFRSIFAGGVYFFAFTFVLWGIGAFLVNRRDA